MRHDIRILTISGSLRRNSTNSALLGAVAGLVGTGTTLDPWTGLRAVPPFDEDTEDDTPAAVTDLRAAIDAADALLVSTPEYNGSVPGQLKNALDWASRPYGASVLEGLPVAVTSAGPSDYGATRAGEQLAAILDASGGSVLPTRVAVPTAHEAFTPDGRLLDPAHEAALTALLAELRTAVVDRRAGGAAA